MTNYAFTDSATTPLNHLAKLCHADNQHFWHDLETGRSLVGDVYNNAAKFALMHSELSEAFEGMRKDLMDSHITSRKAVDVELADLLIRLFDYAGAYGIDLDGAVRDKLAYNKTRADHSREARLAKNGKKI